MSQLIPIGNLAGPSGPAGQAAPSSIGDAASLAAYVTESAGPNAFSTALKAKYLRGWADPYPLYVYGNSYSVLNAGWASSGKHWTQLLAQRLGRATTDVTSYGVGGRRIGDVINTLATGISNAGTGMSGVIAAGKWPGTSSRRGPIILESLGNDIGHYPSMAVSPVVPTKITTANTNYLDSMKVAYRLALAIMSSESYINQTAATFGGTWLSTAAINNSALNTSNAYASAVGASITYSVTPPQWGPFAGKVFIPTLSLGPTFQMAAMTISIDGAAATAWGTAPTWEVYTGHTGGSVGWCPTCLPAITLPIDGAAHTITITHAGSAGQYIYIDDLIIPSVDPNPIIVPGRETPPVVKAGVFDANGITAWNYNSPLVHAAVKSVVAEFPNAVYVPSNLTQTGLYSGDGLHPNDRGMAQIAADVALAAGRPLSAWFETHTLDATADASFAII